MLCLPLGDGDQSGVRQHEDALGGQNFSRSRSFVALGHLPDVGRLERGRHCRRHRGLVGGQDDVALVDRAILLSLVEVSGVQLLLLHLLPRPGQTSRNWRQVTTPFVGPRFRLLPFDLHRLGGLAAFFVTL